MNLKLYYHDNLKCHHFAKVWEDSQSVTLRIQEIGSDVQGAARKYQVSCLPCTGNCWNSSVTVHSEVSLMEGQTIQKLDKTKRQPSKQSATTRQYRAVTSSLARNDQLGCL